MGALTTTLFVAVALGVVVVFLIAVPPAGAGQPNMKSAVNPARSSRC